MTEAINKIPSARTEQEGYKSTVNSISQIVEMPNMTIKSLFLGMLEEKGYVAKGKLTVDDIQDEGAISKTGTHWKICSYKFEEKELSCPFLIAYGKEVRSFYFNVDNTGWHLKDDETKQKELEQIRKDNQSKYFKKAGFMLKDNIPKTNWLIKYWLPNEQSTAMLYGASQSGKTFLVMDWILSIVTGQNWNSYTVNQGNVLYLCGEGKTGISKRIKIWQQVKGDNQLSEELLNKHLMINKIAFSFSDKEIKGLIDDFTQNCDAKDKPNLIVVDTLSTFNNGDENSNTDMGKFIQNCKKLSETFNCCVLIIHHTKKDEESYRGASALKANVDFQFSLTKKEDSTRLLEQEKNRDNEIEKPMTFKLVPYELDNIFDDEGSPISSCILERINVTDCINQNRDNDLQTFIEACKVKGEYINYEGGVVYHIEKKALSDFFVQNKGKSRNSANKEINPNADRHFLNRLLKSNLVKQTTDTGFECTINSSTKKCGQGADNVDKWQ